MAAETSEHQALDHGTMRQLAQRIDASPRPVHPLPAREELSESGLSDVLVHSDMGDPQMYTDSDYELSALPAEGSSEYLEGELFVHRTVESMMRVQTRETVQAGDLLDVQPTWVLDAEETVRAVQQINDTKKYRGLAVILVRFTSKDAHAVRRAIDELSESAPGVAGIRHLRCQLTGIDLEDEGDEVNPQKMASVTAALLADLRAAQSANCFCFLCESGQALAEGLRASRGGSIDRLSVMLLLTGGSYGKSSVAVARMLAVTHQQLQSLELFGVGVGSMGTMLLCVCIKQNKNTRYLRLHANPFMNARRMLQTITKYNRSLRAVSITGVDVHDDGVRQAVKLLLANPRIAFLDLGAGTLFLHLNGTENLRKLRKAVHHNRTLLHLQFGDSVGTGKPLDEHVLRDAILSSREYMYFSEAIDEESVAATLEAVREMLACVDRNHAQAQGRYEMVHDSVREHLPPDIANIVESYMNDEDQVPVDEWIDSLVNPFGFQRRTWVSSDGAQDGTLPDAVAVAVSRLREEQ